MIDPLAAVIVYLKGNSGVSALCGTRIAPKHKFSNTSSIDAWKTPSKALELRYDPGGTPDIYTDVQNVRLKGACYGEDEYQASRVYGELVGATRASERVVVNTNNGQALIYWLTLDGTPEALLDADITPSMSYIQVYLTARVAETPIT